MTPLRCRSLKVKNLVLGICLIGAFFLGYQLFVVRVIDEAERTRTATRARFKPFSTDSDGDFVCMLSRKVIKKRQVDDDYCDCPLDGHDEPSTNACNNGVFVCRHSKKKVEIPSSWVNDGICDCCDGSDEWKNIESPIHLDFAVQKKIGSYLNPCPYTCTS